MKQGLKILLTIIGIIIAIVIIIKIINKNHHKDTSNSSGNSSGDGNSAPIDEGLGNLSGISGYLHALSNTAIIYFAPDMRKYAYIDMDSAKANKFVNHGGFLRKDTSPNHTSSRININGRYRYYLYFCQGKNTCNNRAVQKRIDDYTAYLRSQKLDVYLADNSNGYAAICNKINENLKSY